MAAGYWIGQEIRLSSGKRYTLESFLGHGAFGEVYRGIEVSSGEVVAVKLLPFGEIDDEEVKIALRHEIQVAEHITHPNVIRVLATSLDESQPVGPFLVMEYADGGTLLDLLKRQRSSNIPIPIDHAREMMIQITQGARAINEKIIHRDIKLDNIMLVGSTLKITDFGISKVVDERTRAQTFKGGQHIMYMAPEGWQFDTNTPKIDVYSVGIIFFEILTLQYPYDGIIQNKGDINEWRRVHLFGTPPDVRTLRSEVSVGLAQLIARMMSKRPQDRPGWNEILRILAEEEPPPVSVALPSISQAVEAAVAKQQATETARLQREEAEAREREKRQLYESVCEALSQRFDQQIQAFNAQFQHGQITIQHVTGRGNRQYQLPFRKTIKIQYFSARDTGKKIESGQLVGGGFISTGGGPGCNLLLIKEGQDDLYGRWYACLVTFMMGNPDRLGSYPLTSDRVEPFGFMAEDTFYDEMMNQGALHIFSYRNVPDVDQVFSFILTEALKG